MDHIILHLGSDVNILTKQTWEKIEKPKLIWSPIQLKLANPHQIIPFGRLVDVPVDVDGVRTITNFEVI